MLFFANTNAQRIHICGENGLGSCSQQMLCPWYQSRTNSRAKAISDWGVLFIISVRCVQNFFSYAYASLHVVFWDEVLGNSLYWFVLSELEKAIGGPLLQNPPRMISEANKAWGVFCYVHNIHTDIIYKYIYPSFWMKKNIEVRAGARNNDCSSWGCFIALNILLHNFVDFIIELLASFISKILSKYASKLYFDSHRK